MADVSQVLGGRYELRSRVGASAGTEVYLAHDRELGREVAVKMLTPAAAAQPDVADRFRRMATMAASLRAPNVVGVFDVAESADGPFLVMEYVDGANLADVERGARLEVRRAAGIAGITESPLEQAIYGSPERLQGTPADASGDLYSLGVLLHEAVTGAPPFGGADAVTITRDKLERTPLPPSATVASVPPAFDAIVERLISPNVARRYHTAEEAAADLERLRAPAARTAALPVVVQTTTLPTE